MVGTEGTFGLLPFAIQIYFYNNPSVRTIGYWPANPESIPEEILEESKKTNTFFVFNENQNETKNPRLKLVAKYKKGTGNTYMRLFKVI